MKTRYRCPACNDRDKTFSRYVDTQTGEYIATNVGRCNREIKCGYHCTPKQYFEDNKIFLQQSKNDEKTTRKVQNSSLVKEFSYSIKKASQPVSVCLIPFEIFKASLKNYEANTFVKFLFDFFGAGITKQLIETYFIGTSEYQFKRKDFPDYISDKGATVFWQIDITGKIRTGKIMLYNPVRGKRIKKPFDHINWVHRALKLPEFKLQQCFFGEHLLQDNTKPVAIVESEKTALIANVYLPQFIWLACGSLTGFTGEKCKALQGRTVTLFPDLNGFEKWRMKAKELLHIGRFTLSDLLERKATEVEKKQGLDLADFLIRFDYKEFALSETDEIAIITEFDKWIKDNRQGGIFKFQDHQFTIKPRNYKNVIIV